MQTIQRIGVASAAKMLCCILFWFGLIYAVILTVFAVLGIGRTQGGSPVSFLIIASFPVIYALIGLVAGAVIAFFYNLMARWIGGIKVELQ